MIEVVDGKVNARKYAEGFISLPNKMGEVVPFTLNPLQEILWSALDAGQWPLIVKARQMGCSTAILAYFFVKCITRPYTTAVVISHEEYATQRLLDKVKSFEHSVPPQVKPPLHHKSTYEMTWPDIKSTFYIGTARAVAFGRGDTIHLCHLSEPAFYMQGKDKDLEDGVTQAVPTDGIIGKESTPNGRSGFFFDSYMEAKEGNSRFTPFFFPWWFDPEYRLPEGSMAAAEHIRWHFEVTEEESNLMMLHGLTMEQIRWRRAKIIQLKGTFKQEYPENDIDCWLVKGIAAMPTNTLLAMATRVTNPFYDDEGIRKWRGPAGGINYIVSVDAARGLPTSDPSAAVVINTRECTHDATIRGKFPTDTMAAKICMVATEYNNATVVVERDGHGDAILKFLERQGYKNIWKDRKGKLGWTTGTNRNAMLDELRTALRTNTLQSWDSTFVNEALDFQYIDGKDQAPSGGHDDMVMAMAIAMSVRQHRRFITPGGIQRPAPWRYAEGMV